MKEYQLEYLLAVVEMKNFTRAAKYLNITQPTLSKAISTLEEEIGFQLFVRSRGGIVLTDGGTKFLSQAKNVVREMQELSNCITKIKAQEKEVTIGIDPLLGCIFVQTIEEKLAELHSDITIHWVENGTYGLDEQLSNGSIDIAILSSENVDKEKFKVCPLSSVEEVLCVPHNHPLANKKTVKPEDIKDEKFVLFQEKANQSSIFRALNINPQRSSYTSQITTAMELVSAGKGVMILHKPIYESFKDSYKIRGIALNPKLKLDIVIAYRESLSSDSGPIKDAVDMIKKSV